MEFIPALFILAIGFAIGAFVFYCWVGYKFAHSPEWVLKKLAGASEDVAPLEAFVAEARAKLEAAKKLRG